MLSTEELRSYGHTSPIENFVQYLRNSGIFQVLEEAISILYEIPTRPRNAVEFLAEYVENNAFDMLQTLSLRAELCFKTNEVEELHRKIAALDRKIDYLKLVQNNYGTEFEAYDEECIEDLVCQDGRKNSDGIYEAYCDRNTLEIKGENEDEDDEEYQQSIPVPKKRECFQEPPKLLTPSEKLNQALADRKKFDPWGLVFPNVNPAVPNSDPSKLFQENAENAPKPSEPILSIAGSLAEYFRQRRLPETEEIAANDTPDPTENRKIAACLNTEKEEWDTVYWDQFLNNGCFSLLDAEINVSNFTQAAEESQPRPFNVNHERNLSELTNPGLIKSEISHAIQLTKVWRTNPTGRDYTKDTIENPSQLIEEPNVIPPHETKAPSIPAIYDDPAQSFDSRKSSDEYPENPISSKLSVLPSFANVRSDKYKQRSTGGAPRSRSGSGLITKRKTTANSNSPVDTTQETRRSGGSLGTISRESDMESLNGWSVNAPQPGDGPQRMSASTTQKKPENRSSNQRSGSKSYPGSQASGDTSESGKYFDPQSTLLHLRANDGMPAASLMNMAKLHFGSELIKKIQEIDPKLYDGI